MVIKRDDHTHPHSAQENEYGDGATWIRGPLLGEGGFGRVYKANRSRSNFDSRFPFEMAVKSAQVSRSGTLMKEKEILTDFNASPYVITCFGDETTVSKHGVMAYNLLLEYASGGTLSDRIKKMGGNGLPEVEVSEHTRSILRGLHHIHSLGYVHCDMKPDNILLVPNDGREAETKFRAKIGDFGLAKRGQQSINNYKKRKIMQAQHWRGTPMYLSPEAVIHNVQEAACDVWAVGCIVLNMLTGKPAWEGKNTQDIVTKIGTENELPRIPKEISEDASHFLTCCFERNPMYRLTAELLLEHPFLDDLGNGDEDDDDAVEEEEVESSCSPERSSSWCDQEDGDEPVEEEVVVVPSSQGVWPRRETHPIRYSNIPAVNLMRLMAK